MAKHRNYKNKRKNTGDSLTNVITGMGTMRDSRSFSHFTAGVLTDFTELEAAYIDNWIARSIIDIPIEDSTREWRSFNNKDSDSIILAEKKFNIQAVTQEVFAWAGIYGGAGVLPIIDGQSLSDPLNMDSIKKGSLKNLIIFDRTFIHGRDINMLDPLNPNFGLPDVYHLNGGKSPIHHSRFIRVDGNKMPRRLRMLNGGWGDSRLRQCMEDIKDAVAAKGGIANLITKANIDTITRDNLIEDLSDGDMDSEIAKRYHLFGLMESMFRLALLDSSETLDRKQVSFGGLGEVLSNLMEWTCGAAKIPMTRLFGVQSKGVGDSGQGDMRNYYSNIRGQQEAKYRPFLQSIDEIVLRSELGRMPDDYGFEFNPLTQLTDEEIANQRFTEAQTDDIRLNQGVIKRSQIAKKLQEQAVYAITDNDIKSLEADESAEREGDYFFKLANAAASIEGSKAPETDTTHSL